MLAHKFQKLHKLQVAVAHKFLVPQAEIRQKKGKGKSSQSATTNEIAEEICALWLTRENELEVMNKLSSARSTYFIVLQF